MSELTRLIQASAHDLPMVESESVQCIVTSPPYFGLRLYDGEQAVAWPQVEYAPMAGLPTLTVPAMECPLGNEPTIEAYIGHLILCLREWWRVLKADGVAWVNLGDSYTGSGKGGDPHKRAYYKFRHGYKDGRANRDKRKGAGGQDGIKPKNLMLIPARFALAAQADGWIVRSGIIWHKPNPMPESVTDRPTKAHEYIYLLAKQERYFYDADAVREPNTTKGDAPEGKGRQVYQEKYDGYQDNGSQQAFVTINPKGRNMRSVWTVATAPYPGSHFACFPPALIQPMIKAGSRVGDVVADFFNGSGTTGREAVRLGRRYIGADLSAKYLDELAPERMTVQMDLIA